MVCQHLFIRNICSILPCIKFLQATLTKDELKKQKRYINECCRRIHQQKFVLEVLVFDSGGVPLKTTLNKDETLRYTGLIQMLIDKSWSAIRKINGEDAFVMMRIRTIKFEIIVSKDDDLYFVVLQNPQTKIVKYDL